MIGVGRARVMILINPSRPIRIKDESRTRYSHGWRRPRNGTGIVVGVRLYECDAVTLPVRMAWMKVKKRRDKDLLRIFCTFSFDLARRVEWDLQGARSQNVTFWHVEISK